MATITHSSDKLAEGVVIYTWEAMGDDDEGSWLECPAAADKTVQIDDEDGSADFGGATVTLQGSMDKVEAFSLTDADGNAIAVTASAMRLVRENPRYIRPISAGGSGTDVNVTLLTKKTH